MPATSARRRRATEKAASLPPAKRTKRSPQVKHEHASPTPAPGPLDDWAKVVQPDTRVWTRPPALKKLHPLTKFATDAAVRGFKQIWSDAPGNVNGSGEKEMGRAWKRRWRNVPPELQEAVRDGVFKMTRGLKPRFIQEVFTIPPALYLPGELLSHVATAGQLEPFIPRTIDLSTITSLTLTRAIRIPDEDIARLLEYLPNLEALKLKGCTLAGQKTAKTLAKRCPRMRSINLKGTAVVEKDVEILLRTFGQQIEVFKVDKVKFKHINTTFDSEPYPKLERLCIPGDFLNTPSRSTTDKPTGEKDSTLYPSPAATPKGSRIQWSRFGKSFPALTHLYLPGLLVPHGTNIKLANDHTLVKVSFGDGGPPVPAGVAHGLVQSQRGTLQSIHLGNIRVFMYQGMKESELDEVSEGFWDRYIDTMDFSRLSTAISECFNLERFRWRADEKGLQERLCRYVMKDHLCTALIVSRVLRKVKRIELNLPATLRADTFLVNPDDDDEPRPLEHFIIPMADIPHPHRLAVSLPGYPNLVEMDVAGVGFIDDDMRSIIEACPLLSRINVTSCKKVKIAPPKTVQQAYELPPTEPRKPRVTPCSRVCGVCAACRGREDSPF
ncbi:hypothetical protein IAT38_005184 [Cryptococcus sp. DSM 104549]